MHGFPPSGDELEVDTVEAGPEDTGHVTVDNLCRRAIRVHGSLGNEMMFECDRAAHSDGFHHQLLPIDGEAEGAPTSTVIVSWE